ncbi:MAG: DNA replication/repair protein RecF [Spirochaetales bacterium]|nr:DNA replication/repair protein RecF [Spirochaetales bacterium]
MGFASLRFSNYRNLENESITFSSEQIFLIGENGQGKTNCIEALYSLCYGSSFRTHNDRDIIKLDEDTSYVVGTIVDEESSEQDICVSLFANKKKEILVNGKKIHDRKDLLQIIPCVVFSHDDLEFIKGTPASKRKFFNQTLCLYDIYYLDALRNYSKVVSARNLLLKQRKNELLDVYTHQVAEIGFHIQMQRREMIEKFNIVFRDYFKKVSRLPGEISIVYSPSWKQTESYETAMSIMNKSINRDMQYGTTTTGPHRDTFLFLYDGKDFCSIGSTGQLRLLSIILRVAQAHFFHEYTGKKPLLLLDDVLLELDKKRRELFVNNLPEYEQAFFTFLPDEDYNAFKRDTTEIFRVEKGRFRLWTKQDIF